MICKSLFGLGGRTGTPNVPCGGGNPTKTSLTAAFNSSALNAPERLTQPPRPASPGPQTATGLSFPSKTNTAVLVSPASAWHYWIPSNASPTAPSPGNKATAVATSSKGPTRCSKTGGLNAGWCRAFGLAAHTIGALALAVVHNLRETKRLLSRQKRNGATPEPALNAPGPASTTEESPSNTLSTQAPP